MVTEHASEAARQALEGMTETLHEHLERESATRETQHDAIKSHVVGQRTALTARLDQLESTLASHREEWEGDSRSLKNSHAKFTEELARHAREVRGCLDSSLAN